MQPSELACSAIQALWMSTCLPETLLFKHAVVRSLKGVQAEVLHEIVTGAAGSEFARKHRIEGNTSVAEFRDRVAVNEYEDLQPWIEKIADGGENILSREKVLMFEETSGSTSGSRLIPYTNALQKAFNRALHPWLFDLYSHVPAIWGGPAYWVVTPRTAGRKTSGGVPVGFAADSDYFGRWAKPLIDSLMAVPDAVKSYGSGQTWRYLTLLSLLRCDGLRLISLWNPTFFTALINDVNEWAEELAADLHDGTCCSEKIGTLAPAEVASFCARPMPLRAKLLTSAVAALRAGRCAEFAGMLWPELAMISSWTEAEAASGAAQLREYFPRQIWQSKGLLATEGAVTLPVLSAPTPVLAARSAFFEFEEGEEGGGDLKLAHELEAGGRYRVIMTTFGGLYRYRLHDIVEMRGWWRRLPCLAFIGKEAMVCDLSGEKLSAAHIKAILNALPGKFVSAFVAPEKPSAQELPGYLLIASKDETSLREPELATALESALCQNIHYRWSREAGQLQAARVMLLPISPDQLVQLRQKRVEEEGVALSTAKHGVLSRQPGWVNWLSRQF